MCRITQWRLIEEILAFGQYVPLDAALKNTQHKNCFALRIQDDSMSPRINAGDIVILNPDEKPKPGGLVAVKIINQPGVIIRQYKKRSINNAFETFLIVTGHQLLYTDRQ